MTTQLTVSVVIPVYNGERFLGEAIDSILAQTRSAAEVIVVDDGSTDGSLAIAEGYAERHPEVVVATRPNGGASAARNTGIALATGDALAFLDADDIAEPQFLAVQLGRLEADPSLAGVMGAGRVFVEPGAPEPVWLTARQRDVRTRPRLMTMVVHRSVFTALGVFDTGLSHGEDTDWVLRCGEAGHRIDIHTEVLIARRVHHHNLTQDTQAVVRSQFEVLARRIRRKTEES